MVVGTGRAAKADRWQAILTAGSLTRIFNRMYRRMAAEVVPEDVVRVLRRARVRFVLMGTHGVGVWRSEPRGTQDVDVLVTRRDHSRAVRALKNRFGDLVVRDHEAVTRFIDPATDREVIDLMKPVDPLFRAVFRNTVETELGVRVPNLEMALAAKFAAMVSPNRRKDKKLVDGGDFYNIAAHHQQEIDLAKLKTLGDKAYPGGGFEILEKIEAVRENRDLIY